MASKRGGEFAVAEAVGEIGRPDTVKASGPRAVGSLVGVSNRSSRKSVRADRVVGDEVGKSLPLVSEVDPIG